MDKIFIDPKVDWAFKRIFGQEDTKELLLTFLNGLFEGEMVIKDVKFEKTEQIGLREDQRGIVFDVYCTTDEGKHIIVEMQNKEQEYFVDRALYYTARTIVGQGIKGSWNYHLTPVYTVCLMNFVSKDSMLQEFRTDLALCNLKNGTRESEKFRIIYLLLPLFPKQSEAECDNIFDCWIYVLKNMNMFEQMPFREKYPVFRKLAKIGDLRKLSREDLEKYDEDIKNMRDIYATREFDVKQGREQGMQEGIKKGMKQGMEKGIEKGRKQGMEKGRKQGKAEGVKDQKIASARMMLADGLSLDKIILYSGLTKEQIMKLN